MTALLFL
jgi:primosomal protein N'